MKIRDGFVMKDVAGSNVVLPLGDRQAEVNGIITFNEIGAEVFNMLDGTNSVEQIATKIANNYNAPYEVQVGKTSTASPRVCSQHSTQTWLSRSTISSPMQS